MCSIQNLGSRGKGQGHEGHSFVSYKSSVSHNSKTNKENLIKLHRKVKQNEKVCRIQKLGSTTKVQVTIKGHSFVTYKSCVSHNSQTSKENLIKFHRKVEPDENVFTHKIQVPTTKVKGTIEGHRFVTYELCLSHNKKIDMIKHKEKVRRAQPRSRS